MSKPYKVIVKGLRPIQMESEIEIIVYGESQTDVMKNTKIKLAEANMTYNSFHVPNGQHDE